MAMTEKQTKIDSLLKEGKQAREIADIMGVSPNAIHQQIARMRKAGKGGARKSTAKKPRAGRRGVARAPRTPTPTPTATKTATPLQAIRARRDQVQERLKGLWGEVETTRIAFAKAIAAHETEEKKVADEVARLTAAESALTGPTKVKRQRKATTAGENGATAPEPQPEPQAHPQPEPTATQPEPESLGAAIAEEEFAGSPENGQTSVPASQEEREETQDEFDRLAGAGETAQG